MEGDKPLVSIGMPVRNGGKWIRRALDSLLIQTYPNFELIISDNASDDETEEICREYAEKDNRIRYTRNQENIGMNANFKKVLDLSKGKYFMWAAVDDYWYPDFVRRCVEELETHPEAGVAMTALQRYTEDGEYIDSMRFEPDSKWNPNNMNHLRLACSIMGAKGIVGNPHHLYHSFIYGLFRRDLLSKAMEIPIPEVPAADRLFMTQIALATKFRYIDEFLHISNYDKAYDMLRHREEEFMNLRLSDKLCYTKTMLAIEPYLRASKIIPEHRKTLISLIMDAFRINYVANLYIQSLNPSLVYRTWIDGDLKEDLEVLKQLVKLGHLQVVHTFVSALAAKYPDNADVLSALAEIIIADLGKSEEKRKEALRTSEKIISDILKDCPDHAKSLALYARLLFEEGRIEEAINYMKRALRHYENNIDLRIAFAKMLLKAGCLKDSSFLLRQVLESAPDHKEAKALLALIETGQKEKREPF